MKSRRLFIKRMGAWAGASPLLSLLPSAVMATIREANQSAADLSPYELARNEEYWASIQQAYTVSPQIINLNNGGVSPQPLLVQNAVERYNRMSNEGPTYFMWRVLDQGREPLRQSLAELAGVTAEEVAIHRNATEALDTIIFGLDLQKDDEVVLTRQDYPNMIQAWKQREMREGIKLRWLNLDLPIESDDVLVQKFTDAFTPKTKVVHITHIINWTGQILPVAKIAKEAHKRNIEVVVDGAHSFALLDYKIPELSCDYFGTSLHKWLSAPFGTGMLYVKKEKVKKLWPLFPSATPQADDIRKFEVLGTRSFANEQAIGQAIQFQHSIGAKRKEERLRYLKNYWAEKVAALPRVKLYTSLKPEFSCAIATFAIEGMEPSAIDGGLFNKYKIHTSPTVWESVKGVRVTPHVYTTLRDLDKLVEGITFLAKQ